MKSINISISIIFIIVFNASIYSQKTDLSKINIGEIITLEKSSLNELKTKKRNLIEKNTNSFSFADFSFDTTDLNINDIYFKLFFEKNKIKRILFFDEKYPDNNLRYFIEINKIKHYNFYHIYSDYKRNNSNWIPRNYNGFIISDIKTGINLFFGYNHYSGFMSVAKDIDRIFLLDNCFITTKKLLFQNCLKYKTEPVREEGIYKYEKSFKTENEEITNDTKIKEIIEMMKIESSSDFKILYMLFFEDKLTQFRTKKYPLWRNITPSYFPCNLITIDKKKKRLYYRRIHNNDTTMNMLIDDKIRGELECFEWFY